MRASVKARSHWEISAKEKQGFPDCARVPFSSVPGSDYDEML
jgi:hypothetical protein